MQMFTKKISQVLMVIAVFIIQPIAYFSLASCNWVVGVIEWIIALVHGRGGGVSRDFDY